MLFQKKLKLESRIKHFEVYYGYKNGFHLKMFIKFVVLKTHQNMDKNTISLQNKADIQTVKLPLSSPNLDELKDGLRWLERFNKGEVSDDDVQKLDEKLLEQECNVCYASQFG